MNTLFRAVMEAISDKTGVDLNSHFPEEKKESEKIYIIPPNRTRYLSEIAENNRSYDKWVSEQSNTAQNLFALRTSIELLKNDDTKKDLIIELEKEFDKELLNLDPKNKLLIENWEKKKKKYRDPVFKFKVRDKELSLETHTESLSHTQIPKVVLPHYQNWGDILNWTLQENVPGEYPFTAGLFPFKREGEDPTRMFAGEGGPERTNRRFHYVSLEMPAKRLSTAFDSVTLYGNDPDLRPDIYGKIGNASSKRSAGCIRGGIQGTRRPSGKTSSEYNLSLYVRFQE